jgi:hypothetical protein
LAIGQVTTLRAVHTGDPTPATANAFRLFCVSGGMELPAGSLTIVNAVLQGGYARAAIPATVAAAPAWAVRSSIRQPVARERVVDRQYGPRWNGRFRWQCRRRHGSGGGSAAHWALTAVRLQWRFPQWRWWRRWRLRQR